MRLTLLIEHKSDIVPKKWRKGSISHHKVILPREQTVIDYITIPHPAHINQRIGGETFLHHQPPMTCSSGVAAWFARRPIRAALCYKQYMRPC